MGRKNGRKNWQDVLLEHIETKNTVGPSYGTKHFHERIAGTGAALRDDTDDIQPISANG